MCQKISKNEIKAKIEYNQPNSIQIVQNHKNKSEAAMYLSGNIFTVEYLIDCNSETLSEIKNVAQNVPVFVFTDKELQEAWIQSYLNGGISEDRFDRRADFHVFNEINELFCVNDFFLEEIQGECRHELPRWKTYIVDWYNNQSL